MPRHDPPNRFTAAPTPWRFVVGVAALTLVLLSAGVSMAVGVFVVKFGSAAKAQHLAREGAAVEAVLSGYREGRRLSSTVWLTYEYAGGAYRVQVECDDRERCDPQYSRTLAIRVDPADPGELVTVLGATDDSTSLLNSWVRLVHAAIVIAFGGVGAYLWWQLHRQARAERRTSTFRRQ
ncbi:DUF3592 domain-containing protein [Actinoplanes sp. NPDC051851]|uniref:DUF3592 domain-containing protein n=1 Tax=Actinoplanes sp. NPDC051851 TaxID=3154753 RepID=UPI0034470B1D